MNRLSYIDAGRGIAILLVILVHVGYAVPNLDQFSFSIFKFGQMGVQLFFILSAYTLCLSFNSRKEESNRIINFTIRRIFRIAPAYYLALFLYFILSFVEHYFKFGTWDHSEKYTFINTILNTFFIHGFYLPSLSLVPGGWSISTEMCFYIIFPLLFSYFNTKNPSIKSILCKWALVFAVSQIILFAIYGLTPLRMDNFGQILYFNILTQLPVFCIGIAYFQIKQLKQIQSTSKIMWVYFAALIGIIFLYWTPPNQHLYSFLPILAGLAFVILIEFLGLYSNKIPQWLCLVGHYSYGIYLIHFIFASKIGVLIAPKLSFIPPLLCFAILYFCAFSLSYVIARFEYQLIEERFIKFGASIIKKQSITPI